MDARHLPTGTVTFLFSDIEGSTKLLQLLGDAYADVLQEHARIVRSQATEAGGVEISTEGDSFFLVFANAPRGVEAAARIQRALADHSFPEPVHVRMGLHTGEGRLGGDNYLGIDVNRAARIAGAGHGGQVLLSDATRALVERSLPAGIGVRDLGQHRLKDLAHPERLYQLVIEGLPDDFPPPRTLDARPNNLPVQLTSFIGREAELSEMKRRLLDGVRLLTLTGPGGTGKTRLALQSAAESLTGFRDGAFFVDLAPISDHRLVASAIAETLGVTEDPGVSLEDRIAAFLEDKEMLLVLDNFEQVTQAAPLVERLLGAAPGLKVLVTSRAVLHRYGEHEFPVGTLAVPDPGDVLEATALGQYEAVRLFIERASAVKPDFAVTNENAPAVAEITNRLEGLPLAIELAASRIKLLRPEAILERLEKRLPLLTSRIPDAPDRRRTLRGAIEWSYDLLDENEKQLFEHLSVFRGGGTLEAMESVCSLVGGGDTLEGLTSLVDKSLLRQTETEDGEPRFQMLETIREYGFDRLTERGERDALERRHAAHFLGLAEAAEPNLLRPEGALWKERLRRDHDNLRAALRWSIEAGDVETGFRLAGALWRFWHQAQHFLEGSQWFAELFATPGGDARTLARAKGLTGLGGIAYWQGDYPAAEAAYEGALEIYREVGDDRQIAEALSNLGHMPPLRGDLEGGRRLMEEALERFEALGDPAPTAYVKGSLGYLLLMSRDLERARPLLEETHAEGMESPDALPRAMAHHMMGQLERLAGNHDVAIDHYRAALSTLRDAGDVASMLEPLEGIALVASARGDHERAARLTAAVRAAREALGGGPPPEWLMATDVLGDARAAIGDEAVERAAAEGAALTPDEAADEALGDA